MSKGIINPEQIRRLAALGYIGSEAIERAPPPDPRDMIQAHVDFEAGRELVSQGDSDLALKTLSGALDRDPNNVAMLPAVALIEPAALVMMCE